MTSYTLLCFEPALSLLQPSCADTSWRNKHRGCGDTICPIQDLTILIMSIPELLWRKYISICLSVIAFVSKPLYFQPPQKFMQRFFLGCTGPHFCPTNTNHSKNYQENTFGHQKWRVLDVLGSHNIFSEHFFQTFELLYT